VKSVKFQTKIIHDADVKKGTKILRSKGVAGKVRYTLRVTVLKGRAISRTIVTRSVLGKPKSAVYIVGTGETKVVAASVPNLKGVPGTKAGSMRFAQTYIAAKYHWNTSQFSCLVSLWNRESHWRHTARNRNSGAYGIPQAMPGNKMSKFGADWKTNPNTQIKWGVNYIEKRYNTPCGALSHSNSTGWY
jgi:ribosomal protein S28E/S33